jgi:hypothetical protein
MIQEYLNRFEKKYIVKHNGCWEWQGWKNHDGYGFFRYFNKRDIQAHRFSARHLGGQDIDGKVVCHRCDNPGCVNPDHLFTGSQTDNVYDCISKKRHKTPSASIGVETPLGTFPSKSAAARAHKVDIGTISNWLRKKSDDFKRKPNEYYHVQGQ